MRGPCPRDYTQPFSAFWGTRHGRVRYWGGLAGEANTHIHIHTYTHTSLLIVQINTDFTVNRILLASTTRTFDPRKAQRDFGFVPAVAMAEALQRTAKSYPHLRAEPDAAAVAKGAKAA